MDPTPSFSAHISDADTSPSSSSSSSLSSLPIWSSSFWWSWLLAAPGLMTTSVTFIWNLSLICFALCMTFSAGFHLFSCHSLKVRRCCYCCRGCHCRCFCPRFCYCSRCRYCSCHCCFSKWNLTSYTLIQVLAMWLSTWRFCQKKTDQSAKF